MFRDTITAVFIISLNFCWTDLENWIILLCGMGFVAFKQCWCSPGIATWNPSVCVPHMYSSAQWKQGNDDSSDHMSFSTASSLAMLPEFKCYKLTYCAHKIAFALKKNKNILIHSFFLRDLCCNTLQHGNQLLVALNLFLFKHATFRCCLESTTLKIWGLDQHKYLYMLFVFKRWWKVKEGSCEKELWTIQNSQTEKVNCWVDVMLIKDD